VEELRAANAQLLGRVTYEGFAKAWPGMRTKAGEYGEKMNAMPKYVVSTDIRFARVFPRKMKVPPEVTQLVEQWV
jgi:dihydrofolate reductase